MTREEAIKKLERLKNEFLEEYIDYDDTASAYNLAIEALKQTEQKKGKWIDDKGLYRCSSCNELWVKWWAAYMEPVRMYKEMKYCPNCGAKMEEEKRCQ